MNKNYRQKIFNKRLTYFFTDKDKRPIIGASYTHLGSLQSLAGVAPVMMRKYNNERQASEPKAEYWEVV